MEKDKELQSNEEKLNMNDMLFGNNLDTFSKNDTMNREYLYQLYDEDMDFLNKEIRMTRTQYIAEYTQIEEKCNREIAQAKKDLIVPFVIFVVVLLFAFPFYALSIYYNYHTGSGPIIAGVFIIFFRWIVILNFIHPIFFLLTCRKKIKTHKRHRDHALESLERLKNDCMAAGVYDAGR